MQGKKDKSTKETELSGLKEDLRRLKDALTEVKSAHETFSNAKSKYDKAEINDSDWKGQTRSKTIHIKENMDTELKTVADDFDDSIKNLEDDISKKKLKSQVLKVK